MKSAESSDKSEQIEQSPEKASDEEFEELTEKLAKTIQVSKPVQAPSELEILMEAAFELPKQTTAKQEA